MTESPIGIFSNLIGVVEGGWKNVFDYLADVPDAKPTASDYAFSVRKLYDLLVANETSDEAVLLREELLLLISAQLGQGFISKKHHRLVDGLLPKSAPTRRGRGRPRGAGCCWTFVWSA